MKPTIFPFRFIKLGERAFKFHYPNGYWGCDKHGLMQPTISHGEQCPLCKCYEPNPQKQLIPAADALLRNHAENKRKTQDESIW